MIQFLYKINTRIGDLHMKTNLFFVNTFVAITFLITHANIWSMFDNHIIIDQYKKYIQNKIRDSEKDKLHSLIATQYNSNNTFLKLPNEIFQRILTLSINTTKPLKDIIKPTLLLSTTCKKFNTEQFLITMGKACKDYSLEEKNKAMEMLLKSMNSTNYHNRRHVALLLTYAGAENNAYRESLLENATLRSDEQMIIALFENGANPNQKNFNNNSICFAIEKLPIAQIFVKYGANLNTSGDYINPNILFACLCYNYSSEFIEFYLNNKVDVTKKDSRNNNLLHQLAYKTVYLPNIDYIKIGTLFIKTAPELLNALNDDKKTPLDVVKQKLKTYKQTHSYNIQLALAKLFEEYGGKTAEQLKQEL